MYRRVPFKLYLVGMRRPDLHDENAQPLFGDAGFRWASLSRTPGSEAYCNHYRCSKRLTPFFLKDAGEQS